MREIKFRAWNPVDMEMIADPLVYDDVGINDNFENFKDDEYYLMQFTGLLDKEGKEIYEGDIVRYNMIDGEDICEVFWDVGTVKMKFRESEEWQGYSVNVEDVSKRVEVIGNIYESPELLKATV